MNISYKARAVLASVVGVALVGSMAVSANANGGPLPDNPTTGSLTIHKQEQPDTEGKRGNGLEDVNATSPGIDNIRYVIRKVNEVDLRTNDGWKNAVKLSEYVDGLRSVDVQNGNADGFNFTLGEEQETTTANGGQAIFSDLPLGQYVVTEKLTEQQAKTIKASNAFAVTVPMTHPERLNEWIYNVHAYPKSIVSSLTKTVDNATLKGQGDNVNEVYTISREIPGGNDFDFIGFVDPIDPAKATYKSLTLGVKGGELLEVNTDYTVDADAPATGVKVKVLPAGVIKLKQAKLADGDAVVELKVTVTPVTTGEITNTAYSFLVEGDMTDVNKGTPSNEVVSKWGGVKIVKKGSDNKFLEGAVFEVWASNTNNFKDAQKVNVKGQTEWTTAGAGGEIAVNGLRYSAFADNDTVEDGSGKYNYYWLVETKAPTGYELLAEPVAFTVDDNSLTVGVEVINAKTANGKLPLTGSTAQALAIVAGALMLAGSVAFYARYRTNGARN